MSGEVENMKRTDYKRSLEEIEKLFWTKLIKETEDECWIFGGAKNRQGYGQLWNGTTTVRAHRFAYESANKCTIPKGKMILHKCDNKACCNPKHLYCGNGLDNANDRDFRKRGNIEKIAFSLARFHAGEIWLIRKLRRIKQKDIAKMFKTSSNTIGNILRADKYPCKEGYYA